MSRKRTTYSADFKAKTVLEILEGEKTLNEIASKYGLLPKNLPCACTLFEKIGRDSFWTI